MITSTACVACGMRIPDGANACVICGADRGAEPFFYPLSLAKLVLLGTTSFGLYLVWWFWSQWRAEAPNESRGTAALKTIFSGFFFYSIARQVKETADTYGVPCGYLPAVLTGCVWANAIAVRILPPPWQVLPLLCVALPLVPVQVTINRVTRAASQQQPEAWRRWEIVLAVVLGLYWTLGIIGLLLPMPPQ